MMIRKLIGMIREVSLRTRYGYPIGEGFRLSAPSRNERKLHKEGHSFVIPVEFDADGKVVVYLSSCEDNPLAPVDFHRGGQLLVEHLRRLGKKVAIA